MSHTSQEFAGLSNDVYEDRAIGRREPNERERVEVDGQVYRIIENASNPETGYQGAIYQRESDGAIVVSHRGTEEIWKDAVITDGSMVVSRTNPQAEDAIALTQRALEEARKYGVNPPPVSVTGHSLGGALAQISAHHFDLPGETFNAYGAASLDRRIPEGPNGRMVNHVMANDPVSAASPHYGEVRTYATEQEISVLKQSGYHDGRLLDLVTPDSPVVAAGRSFGSHSMHNFLQVDGDGRPDTSVLQDPAASARAEEHSRSIGNYRDDVETLRRAVTVGARGPVGIIKDGIDHIRGPLPAGEPARREAEERGQQGASLDTSTRGEPGSQQDHVAKLLDAAKAGNTDAMRAATQNLQASETGQAWQQQAEAQAQQLVARDAAQQRDAQQQEAARSA